MKSHPSFRITIVTGIICILILSYTKVSFAQNENTNRNKKGDIKSHLFYGGGFGLQFGTVTLIELSPIIGYKITSKFGIGLSPTYKYYRYKNYYTNSTDIVTHVYGGGVFARYLIFENVFAHAEYETLYLNTKIPGFQTELLQYNSVLVGGGYRQQMGWNSSMYILVLWNLNDTPDSPYSNPVIRVGFTIGM